MILHTIALLVVMILFVNVAIGLMLVRSAGLHRADAKAESKATHPSAYQLQWSAADEAAMRAYMKASS